MMKLLIYIQAVKDPLEVKYQNPLKEITQSYQPNDVLFLEIDNFSETFLLNAVQQQIGEATTIVVLIEAKLGSKLGGILPFISRLYALEATKKIKIFYKGNHSIIEKMLKPLSPEIVISDFISSELANQILSIILED
jgi:hypothetical protein